MTVKPGYKTTEFLVTVLMLVGVVVASAADWLPPRYASIAAAVSAAAYALARGITKRPAPVLPVVPGTTVAMQGTTPTPPPQ